MRWVVRHACAGHKDDWDGDDDERPLDPAGTAQAEALARLLAGRADRPRRLVSSPPLRCTATLEPLGRALGLEVEVDPALRRASGPELVALTADGVALCTHGEVMEPALPVLRSRGLVVAGGAPDDELLLKGAAWGLSRADATWHLDLVAPLPRPTCPRHG